MKNCFKANLFYSMHSKKYLVSAIFLILITAVTIFVIFVEDNLYKTTPALVDNLYEQLENSRYTEAEIGEETYYVLDISISKLLRIVNDKDIVAFLIPIGFLAMLSSENKRKCIIQYVDMNGSIVNWYKGKFLFMLFLSLTVMLIQVLMSVLVGTALWPLAVEGEHFLASIFRIIIGSGVGNFLLLSMSFLIANLCNWKFGLSYVGVLLMYYVLPIGLSFISVGEENASSYYVASVVNEVLEVQTGIGEYTLNMILCMIYIFIFLAFGFFAFKKNTLKCKGKI